MFGILLSLFNVWGQSSIGRGHRIVDHAMHTFKGGVYVAQNLTISMYIDILLTMFMVYSNGLYNIFYYQCLMKLLPPSHYN
jgi:hypothetical protein